MKPLGEEEILNLFSQMIEAIQYLHDHHILHRYIAPPPCQVPSPCNYPPPSFSSSPLLSLINAYLYRDLKTANVFLTKDRSVKVGDFGISKILSDTKQEANTVLGTPYYISPEIVSNLC